MCVEGSRLLRQFCLEHKVPMNECGTLVIARNDQEIEKIQKLKTWAQECGVPDLIFLNPNQIKDAEPRALGMQALLSPTGAVVDSLKLINKIKDETSLLGAKFYFMEKVIAIEKNRVITGRNIFKADHIINCAGLYADQIAHMMDVGLEFRVIPFRGEYLEIKDVEVRSMIYQPPDLRFPFLSVHLTREINGRVLAGPTAVLSFGRESYQKQINIKETIEMFCLGRFYRMALKPSMLNLAFKAIRMSFWKKYFIRELSGIIGPIESNQVESCRSGIRAQVVDQKGNLVDDHLVFFEKNSTHVLNCVSPGMTSSLAFAKYLDRKIHQ